MTGIPDYQAREHLLAVLKERGIQLGKDDVAWAFASPRTRDEIIAWVKEYLQEDTLLSNDEIELFQEITSGRTSQWDSHGGLAVNDNQLSEALEALQASTNMIEQHTRTLQKQRDALESMRQQADNRRNALADQSSGQSRNALKGASTVMIDETALSLEEDFNAAFKCSNRAVSSLTGLTSERLGADDEVLAALSKLAPRTMPPSSDGTSLDKIEQWTKALSIMREQEANARIDAMINQNIIELSQSGNSVSSGADEISQKEEIESELQTLRGEIGSVVELVVGSEFRQPLLRLLKGNKSQTQNLQHEWLGYVLATMEHMIRQVDELAICASDIRSYNNTLTEIRSAFSVIVAGPATDERSSLSNSAASTTSETRRGADPRSSVSNTNLAEQIFRRFSVAGRVESKSLQSASEIAISKLQSQYSSAAQSTAEVVGKSLEEQRKELQLVLKQLHAFSEFSAVQLLPKDVEEAVQGLDDAIGETVMTLSSAENGKHEDVRRGIAKLRVRLDD